MQKLPMIFVMLLTISLSACVSRPDALVLKQRFVSFHVVEIEGRKYADLELSQCLERDYKYSLEFLGPREKFRNVAFELCDRLTGYAPRPYVDLYNFQEDVRQEILEAQ